MDWADLKIANDEIARLRQEFSIERPEDVVSLAWGAGEALSAVLNSNTVDRIRRTFPMSPPRLDSSGFKLGVRWGDPPRLGGLSGEFEEARDSLLSKLQNARSDNLRKKYESDLVELYKAR